MLNALACRENGTINPRQMYFAECSRRALSLQLSHFCDVEKVHQGGINSLDIDLAEGRYLLSCSAGIAIHDLHNVTGSPKFTHPCVAQINRSHKDAHKFSVETVQWYPLDTGMFTSSGADKLLKIWDANYPQVADEYEFRGLVSSHDMSSVATQHSLLSVASQSAKIHLLDLKSGSSTHALKGHRHGVISVAWSTKDEYLLASGAEDGKIFMWDVRQAKGALMILDQHNGTKKADTKTVNTAHDGKVNGLGFSPDGLRLLSYGTDNVLRVWDTASGTNTLVNFGKISNDSKKCVRFTMSSFTEPDLVFIPTHCDIGVFSIDTGELIYKLKGHYSQVNCTVITPEEHILYTGSNDRNLLIWTPVTEAVLAYEGFLQGEDEETSKKSQQQAGLADAWSDEEDDD